VISVKFVCNEGDGLTRTLSVREGTLVEDFLNVNFQGELDDFTVSVRSPGESSRVVEMDYELEDGDRLTLSPRKIQGA